MKKILKIGHRGAMGHCRENTLPCFEKAIKLGVDMIELDVHFKDNKLFVVHDIEDLNGNTPLLEQVLDLVNKRAAVNIELKGRGTAEPVALLIKQYIKKGWKRDKFLISSFNIGELKDFKKQGLKVNTGFIFEEKNKVIEDIGFYSANPALKITNKKLVDNLHNQGFKVFVWTVNKKRDIKKIMSLGVDGIFSDYPDRL